MILAAVRDDAYNVVLLLHILSVLVAFAPAFVHPVLGAQLENESEAVRSPTLRFIHRNGRRIYAPALVLVGLFGFGLVGMSDDVWSFGDTWIWLSIVLWIALNGVLHAVLLPAEEAMGSGDASAAGRVRLGGMIMGLLGLVVLILMIFKPGS